MASDTSATAQILLEILTRADLAALQNTAKELTVARTAAKAAGQDVAGLDAALADVNRELGSKVLEMQIQRLQELSRAEIAAGTANGVHTQALQVLQAAQKMAAESTLADIAAKVKEAETAHIAAQAEQELAQAKSQEAAIQRELLSARGGSMEEQLAALSAMSNAIPKVVDEEGNLIHAQRESAIIFREMGDAQLAWAAFASGDFLLATRAATLAVRGLTMAILENPITLVIAGLAAAGAAIYEFWKGIRDEQEKQTKEMAENAAQTARATKAAFEQRLDTSAMHAAAQEEIQALNDMANAAAAVDNAYIKLQETQNRLALAQLNLAEKQAVAAAQKRGASDDEIKAIEANFALQRAALEAGQSEKIAELQSMRAATQLTSDRDRLGVLSASRAAENNTYNQNRAQGEAALNADRQFIADYQREKDRRDAQEATLSGSEAIYTHMQNQRWDRDMAPQIQARQDRIAAAQEAEQKAAQAHQQKMQELDNQILTLKNKIEAEVYEAQAARVGMAVAEVEGQANVTGATAQADQLRRDQAKKKAAEAEEAGRIHGEATLEHGLENPALAPTRQAGETARQFQQRQAAYKQITAQAEQLLEKMQANHGGNADQFTQLQEFFTRLLTVVDKGQAANVKNATLAIEHERRISLLEQQQKNSRVQ